MFDELENILYAYVLPSKLDALNFQDHSLSDTEKSILGSILLEQGEIKAFKECLENKQNMFKYSKQQVEIFKNQTPLMGTWLYSPGFFENAINQSPEKLRAYLEMGGKLLSKVFFLRTDRNFADDLQWASHVPLLTLLEVKRGRALIKLPTELLLNVFESECFHGPQRKPVLKKIKLFHEKLLHNFLDVHSNPHHLRQLAQLYPLPLRSAQLLIQKMSSSTLEGLGTFSFREELNTFKQLFGIILDDFSIYLKNRKNQPKKTIFHFSDHLVSIKNRMAPTSTELKYEQYLLSVFEFSLFHENRQNPKVSHPKHTKNKPMADAEYDGFAIKGYAFLRVCQFNFYFENVQLLSRGKINPRSQETVDSTLAQLMESSLPRHPMVFHFLLPWVNEHQKFQTVLNSPLNIPSVHSALISWASSRLEQDKHYQLETGGMIEKEFDEFFMHFYQDRQAQPTSVPEKVRIWLGPVVFGHLFSFSQRKIFLFDALLGIPTQQLKPLMALQSENQSLFFSKIKEHHFNREVKPIMHHLHSTQKLKNINPRF